MSITTTFKEVFPRASDAVKAMVRGLRRPKVGVDMGTFGKDQYGNSISDLNSEEKVCFGCAATCTVLEGMPEWQDHYDRLYNSTDLAYFEGYIDNLREGDVHTLLVTYYGVPVDVFCKAVEKCYPLPYLNNSYTGEDLKPYEELADFLEGEGY